MAPELTTETWTQIRHDYEHTDRPIGDICAEHGVSSGTLRDRVRRWGWTRRRLPIPFEGPPPSPAPRIDSAAPPPANSLAPLYAPEPPPETITPPPAAMPNDADDRAVVPRLQSAVARVLPAIESIVTKLGAGPMHPREMERAARAVGALTRTLRELNNLLNQRQAASAGDIAADDDMPQDIAAVRSELARRIDAFVETNLEQRQRIYSKIDGR